MPAAVNPYAPPKARVEDVVQGSSEAEAIRAEHIKHEASIRSIGVLDYLGGGALCFAAIGLIAMGVSGKANATVPFATALGIAYFLLGVLGIFLGRGVRNLRPWARIASIVLAVIGLLGFPVGTLINGYILYLLLSQKGQRIFAADYPEIVAATPHIKYRTSMLVWVLLSLVALLIVGLLVAAMLRH
jgi:hypothetical protein